MINGFEYAWEDMKISLQGRNQPEEGITELKYTTEKNHYDIMAGGEDPVAMGRGGKKYSASMTVLQSLHEALQRGLPPGKDVTNLSPFLITASYAPEAGEATTDQLAFVRIKKYEKGMKTEDGHQTITYELAVGKIYNNI